MQRNYEVISFPLTHMHTHINKHGGACIEPIPSSCVTVGYWRVNRLQSTNFQLMIRGVAGYETIHRRVFETMAPYSWDPNQLSFTLPALRNLYPSFFSQNQPSLPSREISLPVLPLLCFTKYFKAIWHISQKLFLLFLMGKIKLQKEPKKRPTLE